MKIKILIFILLSGSLMVFTNSPQETNLAQIFPELKDFQKSGPPDEYLPDNLFEYINGAAEVFLSYDFEKLVTISYRNKTNQSLTIDIYRHSNLNNGFGIYSQEKPQDGEFIQIGSQGYYEKGILNFFKGCYYVKMSSFDLGDKDRELLGKAAQLIANKLESPIKFPIPLEAFPEMNKIKNSEKYISRNFMGYGFLHSAFIADYQIGEKKVQVFIIEAGKGNIADEMLKKYLSFARKKGITPVMDNNTYSFVDPYYRASGKMNLRKNKNYLWGLLTDNSELSQSILNQIDKKLRDLQLIK